jgi:hypothetical protein
VATEPLSRFLWPHFLFNSKKSTLFELILDDLDDFFIEIHDAYKKILSFFGYYRKTMYLILSAIKEPKKFALNIFRWVS